MMTVDVIRERKLIKKRKRINKRKRYKIQGKLSDLLKLSRSTNQNEKKKKKKQSDSSKQILTKKKKSFLSNTKYSKKNISFTCCMYCGPYTTTHTSPDMDYEIMEQKITEQILTSEDKVLPCSLCNRKACYSCLTKFVSKLREEQFEALYSSNVWVRDVCAFVDSSGKNCNETFVGSCCNLKIPDDDDVVCSSQHKYSGGDLHVYNANLLIRTDFNTNSIVVNGFGDDNPVDESQKMKGLIHGVTTPSTVCDHTSMDGHRSKLLSQSEHTIQFRHPFTNHRKKFKIKILLYDSNIMPVKKPGILGTLPKHLDGACVVSSATKPKDGYNLILILATSNVVGRYHLIQTEFANKRSLERLNSEEGFKIHSRPLYDKCLAASERHGLSVRAYVGGPVRLTSALDDFLSLPGIFPKKRTSVAFLNINTNKNKLIGLYIANKKEGNKKEGNKTEEAIIWDYNQPSRGGIFHRKPIVKKEQILLDLVECTFVTAKLLEAINNTNILEGKICPHAVDQHLGELNGAYKYAADSKYKDKKQYQSLILDYITDAKLGSSKFHLVAHPCAYHIDKNCQGSSLESKAFFAVKSDVSIGTGRGGILPARLRGGVTVALMNYEERRREAKLAARLNREVTA